MDTTVFITLTNPGMSLIFAATFFLLWNHRREHRHILMLALGYLAISVGFVCQFFGLPSGSVGLRIASNIALLAGAVLIAVGCLARYQIKPPLKVILSVAGAGLMSFAWFLFIVPDFAWRIMVMNFTFGVITLIIAAGLFRIPNPKPIDRLLIGIFLFWGSMFFLRPIATMWIEGPYVDFAGFYESLYWITQNFSASLFILVSALTLISSLALELIDELRTLSHTDPLSGLLNRRGFQARAADLLERSIATPSCALVIADLDRFKDVNDRFGHVAGDAAIVCFSERLREAVGSDHIAGRMGGEEFAILLRGADIRMARLFAEGLRTSFSALEVPGLPAGYPLSASFGVAVLLPGEDLENLLKRADRALYRAKAEGRDRVVVCTNGDGARAPSSEAGRPHLVRNGTAAAAQIAG